MRSAAPGVCGSSWRGLHVASEGLVQLTVDMMFDRLVDTAPGRHTVLSGSALKWLHIPLRGDGRSSFL